MSEKRVTIKDISVELGVSLGIINRALNNKPGVSDELREKILSCAERMGYRANRVARSLARGRISIGVIIPEDWQCYYSPIRSGIEHELDRLMDYNVDGSFYAVKNTLSPADSIKAIESCIRDGVSGILLCDVHPEGMGDVANELSRLNIPVITIGASECTAGKFTASVCTDSYLSGRMAAEMLSLSLKKNAEVLMLLGNKGRTEHSEKARGFTDGVKDAGLRLIGVYETQDDEELANNIFLKLLSEQAAPDGIYLATAVGDSVLRSCRERHLGTKVVGTDVSDRTREYFADGTMICTLFQNPRKQGQCALRILYTLISEGKSPAPVTYVAPSLVINSNLDEFLEDSHGGEMGSKDS